MEGALSMLLDGLGVSDLLAVVGKRVPWRYFGDGLSWRFTVLGGDVAGLFVDLNFKEV